MPKKKSMVAGENDFGSMRFDQAAQVSHAFNIVRDCSNNLHKYSFHVRWTGKWTKLVT
jgi:hypothetical protein